MSTSEPASRQDWISHYAEVIEILIALGLVLLVVVGSAYLSSLGGPADLEGTSPTIVLY
jgi:hypothetical protein